MDYRQLLQYCETDRQREIMQAVVDAGSQRKAAKLMGIHERNVSRAVEKVKRRCVDSGNWPDARLSANLAPTEKFIGRSFLQDDRTGDRVLTWYKSSRDPKVLAAQAIADALENFSPKPAPKIKPPRKTQSDLLTLYTLTDYHLGMYAWADETGDDWDTEIASRVMLNAIDDMMAGSPDSEVAILNFQGDHEHWCGMDAVTPTSGHVLDADTRLGRLIDLTLDLTEWVIERLLSKHKRVVFYSCEGNHNPTSSRWLAKAMKRIMRNNRCVDVDDSEFPFYAYLHGQTMIGFHHGHKVKNKSLPALFASEPRFRGMWGAATYTYIHTGHYHQSEQDMAEGGGAIVERHPTLSARDAYAARGGYVSRRAARAITYHVKDGEVGRCTVVPR